MALERALTLAIGLAGVAAVGAFLAGATPADVARAAGRSMAMEAMYWDLVAKRAAGGATADERVYDAAWIVERKWQWQRVQHYTKEGAR